MNMSTASNKVVQKDAQRDGEENAEGQQPRERKPKVYGDAPVSKPIVHEDDFEVVHEKVRVRKEREPRDF